MTVTYRQPDPPEPDTHDLERALKTQGETLEYLQREHQALVRKVQEDAAERRAVAQNREVFPSPPPRKPHRPVLLPFWLGFAGYLGTLSLGLLVGYLLVWHTPEASWLCWALGGAVFFLVGRAYHYPWERVCRPK